MSTTYTYNLLIETARLNDGNVEILCEFQGGQFDGKKAWLRMDNLQRAMERYSAETGDTMQQSIDRFNREIDEKRK
jgi:hypothetical protein